MDATVEAARRGTAQDIIVLTTLYAGLTSIAKGELIAAAVAALAVQQGFGVMAQDGSAPDPKEWLDALAVGTYPEDDAVATLIGLASEVEPEARAMIFNDGMLAVARCPSEEEEAQGEGIYIGYEYVRANFDPNLWLPEPAKYLNIEVSRAIFTEWASDSPVFDRDAWNDEVRRRCILVFISFVADWRRDFFAALISGRNLP